MSDSLDPVVSFDDEPLVLVDSADQVLGYKDKWKCHQGDGELHRAFSIFIFNSNNELLLQRRSGEKPLWPHVWANSCCSHPRKGEEFSDAVHRRLREELNLETNLKFLFKFEYQARYKSVGSEHELCSVYIGRSDEKACANKNEVEELRYVGAQELDRLLSEDVGVDGEELYSPWLKIEWRRIRAEYWDQVESL